MFEIKYEDINVIDHSNDFWAQRDIQMNFESNETVVQTVSLKESKKNKKKTKIIKKIEKEYEIVNDIYFKNEYDELKCESEKESIVLVKKTRKLRKKEN